MKMKLTSAFVVTVMACIFLTPVNAGYYMTSNKFLSLCKSELITEQNVCVGYVLGVVDAAQMLDEESSLRRYCLPDNVTSSQLEQTAVKYLNDNPDQLGKSASYNLLISLRQAFPCN